METMQSDHEMEKEAEAEAAQKRHDQVVAEGQQREDVLVTVTYP